MEKCSDGERVLDMVADQENTSFMMLEPVQNIIRNLWEGPFVVEPLYSKMSKTTAILKSFYNNGTKDDLERNMRWQPYLQHSQHMLTFEVWK